MYTPDYDLLDKTWTREIKDSLPSFMNQSKDSNNQKLLSIFAHLANIYKNDMLCFTSQMNINNATGNLLTNIAKDYGVVRLDSDDSFLRFEIKFNMWKNHMSPNRNDFMSMMSFLLGLNPRDFNVIQTGLKEYKITNIPWNFYNGENSDLKREMVTAIIQAIAPPEFKLDFVEYVKTDRATHYQATSVGKMETKRVTPKSMNYIKHFIDQPKQATHTYHVDNNYKDIHEKH